VLLLDELHLTDGDPTVELELTGGQTIAAGTSANLWVTWSPEEWSELDDLILIGSNDPTTPYAVVHLTGQVAATPHIVLDPDSVDFGDVPVGNTVETAVVIMNTGHADLAIESVQVTTSDPDALMVEEIATPVILYSGERQNLWIRYTPHDEGDNDGVLTVDSDDPVTPSVHAELQGTGVAAMDTGT
jgi:hypothetical protein